MKIAKYSMLLLAFSAGSIIISSFITDPTPSSKKIKFAYKKAGLTDRQAAAHLLNRFTYGATPGQVDAVVNMGLENWFQQQLAANLPDDSLNKRLDSFPDINLTNTEVLVKYPPGFVVTAMALKDSAISKDSVGKAINQKAYNDTVQAYMQRKGFKSDQLLFKQFINQNIIRAAYTNNQLQEVMTDFWFNHFNVSFTKGESAQFIPSYERDVIRPNVFGNFDKLLMASAKSPAMLYFLDNFISQGTPPTPPAKEPAKPQASAQNNTNNSMMMTEAAPMMMQAAPVSNKNQPNKNVAGLNENYAREVMELHTMGVDGGYTQSDVTQAARVLTGWTIYPISSTGYGSAMKGLVTKIGENNLTQKGFVREGDFLFTPTRHDNEEKTILGRKFPANGGYQEGLDLLEMLAHHPSTANFICKKLATRFVNDNPPQSLIKKMVKTFNEADGDISQVLTTMVSAPEFWNVTALREKTKSPFELVISSVRSLNANVKDPYQLFNWMSRMGQRIYYYQAPTGFPDRGLYWINTGSLLNRMNFGLALASQKIPGVTFNLAALNNHHEPESATAALETYSKLLIPERNLDDTYKQLTPLLTAPDLAAKVTSAVGKTTPVPTAPDLPMAGATGDMMMMSVGKTANDTKPKPMVSTQPNNTLAMQTNNNAMLQQVVGIIIGSPEFQRR